MRDPACEATPFVQNRSFTPIGMPHIAGASPGADPRVGGRGLLAGDLGV